MKLYCPECLDMMKPLFSSYFCPNDCDRRPKCKREQDFYSGPNAGLRLRPVYRQSVLWRPTGYMGCRTLACPYCAKTVGLVCGDPIKDDEDYFPATCKEESVHRIVVWNDEGR